MKTITIALISILLTGCVARPRPAEAQGPPSTMDWDGFAEATEPGVWLGGQPSEDALDEFGARGGRLVVNLRTDEEMAFFPYYERALAGRGMTYVRIPTKGSELDAAELEALEHAVAGHDGPVMLHCASGGRATYLWAMKRMADEGISAEQAVAWCNERRERPWETGAEILRSFEAWGDQD